MLPWRPLGMLAFGLSAIFVFIRLHGDGYDFPQELFRHRDELHLHPLPTRSFMEVSNVVLDDYRDYYGADSDSDSDDRFHTAEVRHDRRQGQDQGHKYVVGWNKQWPLGKDRNDNNSRDGAKVTVATDQASAQAPDDKERAGSYLLKEYQDGKQWIWLTNVWHEDGDCEPGKWTFFYFFEHGDSFSISDTYWRSSNSVPLVL